MRKRIVLSACVMSPTVLFVLAGCTLPTSNAAWVAIVNEDASAALQQALKTNWTLLTSESQPSSEDLSKVSFAALDEENMFSLYSRLPHNKVLQLLYTGFDTLNFSSFPASWTVANVHQAGTPIAEYVLSNMLSWNIGQAKVEADFRKCTWKAKAPGNSCKFTSRHREINGQTLGIIGYGHIGSAIATRAGAFGMKVCAVTQHPQSPPPPELAWMGDDSQLPRLMRESDFVVIAVPLLPSTRSMINESNLALMQRSAVLINIARGPVVDESALYTALKEKRIGGAVLDVWWHPWKWFVPGGVGPDFWPAEHDFSSLDNVVMTPHNSAQTNESHLDAIRQVAANMDHFQRGEPLENVIRNGTAPLVQLV